MGRASPTFHKRRLSRRLREMRERSGWRFGDAARKLDLSTSTLSRVENGQSAPDVHLVRSMMDLYDGYDDTLLDLAREARKRGWWQAYGIADQGYIGMETEAAVALTSQVINVPGLLQTPDYMRALFAAGLLRRGEKQRENDIAARLIRQERLTDGENPLEVAAIVDEAALHRTVGGQHVMRAQLNELVARAELDTVTLQVLPLGDGAHVGMDGAFTILGFHEPDEPELLYVEHPAGAFHAEKEHQVRAARLVHEHLRAAALSPGESAALIERVAKRS